MSNKALPLDRATLELTQKIQRCFPRKLGTELVQAWNGCPVEIMTEQLQSAFGHDPSSLGPVKRVKRIVTRDEDTGMRMMGKLKFVLPGIPRLVCDSDLFKDFEGLYGAVRDFDGSRFNKKVESALPSTVVEVAMMTRTRLFTEVVRNLGEERTVFSLGQVKLLFAEARRSEEVFFKGVLNNNLLLVRDCEGVLVLLKFQHNQRSGWRVTVHDDPNSSFYDKCGKGETMFLKAPVG